MISKMVIEELRELEKNALSRNIPILGSEKGLWLLNKIKEFRPRKILELGTAIGYSGIILASQGAELVSVEQDPHSAEGAKENFKIFNINANVVVGDAVEEVKKLVAQNKKFDLIFIDFAKSRYFDVLEDCLYLTNTKGLIIADNITMFTCQNYKKAVLEDPRLHTEIIAIKDGLSVSEKI